MADAVVILSYARTPMGAFQGALAGVTATELGSAAVKGAVERAGVEPAAIDKVFMGCVLPPDSARPPPARRRSALACPRQWRRPRSIRCAGRGCRRRSSRTT